MVQRGTWDLGQAARPGLADESLTALEAPLETLALGTNQHKENYGTPRAEIP